MGLFNFDCIFHVVRDVDGATSFYRDILGFKPGASDAVARFEIGGVPFELVPANAQDGLTAGAGARLCLAVADLSEARTDLEQKGVQCSDAWEVSGGMLAFFHDPDGNQIYLWQPLPSQDRQRAA